MRFLMPTLSPGSRRATARPDAVRATAAQGLPVHGDAHAAARYHSAIPLHEGHPQMRVGHEADPRAHTRPEPAAEKETGIGSAPARGRDADAPELRLMPDHERPVRAHPRKGTHDRPGRRPLDRPCEQCDFRTSTPADICGVVAALLSGTRAAPAVTHARVACARRACPSAAYASTARASAFRAIRQRGHRVRGTSQVHDAPAGRGRVRDLASSG